VAPLPIPRTLEEMTPEWLTGALREGGVIRDAAVTAVTCTGIGAGAGFLAQLGRLALTYDRAEPGAPATLVAKIPTLDPGGREVSNLFDFYHREIRFYEDCSAHVDLSCARRYYTASDRDAQEYVLLMEDLAAHSQVGDEVAGCTVEQCERAVDEIARFHASWWQSPRLEQLDWMPLVNAPVHQSAEPAYQQAWGPFTEMFGSLMTPHIREVGERMQTRVVALLDLVEPAPRTIIHGDFRADNVFFGGPKGFSVIDWQISSKGRGVFDVAYFLASSCDPALRKQHEMRLLRRWHDVVSRADATDYTFERALLDYRICVLYMHVYTVVGLGSLDAANERGMALFHAWLERRSAAIEDLNAAELMPA
jgi:hypothetical protein